MNLPYTLEKVVTNSDSRSFNENKWRKPPGKMKRIMMIFIMMKSYDIFAVGDRFSSGK